jgi:flagellar biosynthesis/type III secretory pathway protein FliH
VKSWLIHIPVRDDPKGPRADLSLVNALRHEGRPLKGDEARAAFPELSAFADPAAEVATAAARLEATETARKARAAIESERDESLRRIALSSKHQGLSRKEVAAQQQIAEEHYRDLLAALEGLSLALDSVCGFLING